VANKKLKYSGNKPGAYYVDHECIACDACVGIAIDFFKMNDDEGHAYVYSQPKNKEEIGLCEEAKDACPVDAIGNDGE
jgi:ferredoxin